MLLTLLQQSMSSLETSSTELCTVYEHSFTHFLILGREQKQKSKSSLLEAIDVPRKELDESTMLHEKTQVYEHIAAKYPEDLEVVTHSFNLCLTVIRPCLLVLPVPPVLLYIHAHARVYASITHDNYDLQTKDSCTKDSYEKRRYL